MTILSNYCKRLGLGAILILSMGTSSANSTDLATVTDNLYAKSDAAYGISNYLNKRGVSSGGYGEFRNKNCDELKAINISFGNYTFNQIKTYEAVRADVCD